MVGRLRVVMNLVEGRRLRVDDRGKLGTRHETKQDFRGYLMITRRSEALEESPGETRVFVVWSGGTMMKLNVILEMREENRFAWAS